MAAPMTRTRAGNIYLCEVLPVELLSIIGCYLDFPDRLKLRLVLPKRRQRVVDEILKNELSTLYVSPTRSSLANFEEICRSGYYASHVTHVIFVARGLLTVSGTHRIPSPKQYKRWLRMHGEDASDDVALKSFGIYRDLVTDHDLLEGEKSGGTLHILRSGLEQLRQLKAVTISKDITSVALNACSLWYSEEFTKEQRQCGQYTVVRDTASRSAVRACGSLHDSVSVRSFLAALRSVGLSPQSLTLDMGVTGQLISELYRNGCFNMAMLAPVLRKVSRLTIKCTADCGRPYDRSDGDVPWLTIASASIRMKELVLYDHSLPASSAVTRPGQHSIAQQFLLHRGKLTKLDTLRIYGDHDMPGMLDSKLFKIVISNHPEMRKLEITDMLLSDGSKGEDISETMKSVFEYARGNMSRDSKVIMKVHRRDEHHTGVCIEKDDEECNGTCEQYGCHDEAWLHRSVLDDLAEELDVRLVEGSWDFSKCFMQHGVVPGQQPKMWKVNATFRPKASM